MYKSTFDGQKSALANLQFSKMVPSFTVFQTFHQVDTSWSCPSKDTNEINKHKKTHSLLSSPLEKKKTCLTSKLLFRCSMDFHPQKCFKSHHSAGKVLFSCQNPFQQVANKNSLLGPPSESESANGSLKQEVASQFCSVSSFSFTVNI